MATFAKSGICDFQTHGFNDPFFQTHGYTETPILIQCFITLRCKFSCAHCLACCNDVPADDMPLDIFDRLCSEAATLGVQEMLITGGEPLQRNNFTEIVACLRNYGLTWSLNTAMCPDADQQSVILSYPPAYVAVSLDGPADVHNRFRGKGSAFAEALAGIRFFSSIKETTVCAGTTISTVNLPHFEETFTTVKESGAHRWGIHLLIPEGRARRRKDLFPGARQMWKLLKSVALKRLEFPVSLCDEMGYAGEWEGLVRDETFFCAAGRAMCAVLPDASIMPCSTLDPSHCEGNLKDATLAEIWNNAFIAQRNPRRESKCSRCNDWAVCRSGCWLQRQHGTHCFKHLWEVPKSFKTAAGIGLCLGALGGSNGLFMSTLKADDGASGLPADVEKTKTKDDPNSNKISDELIPKAPQMMPGILAMKSGTRKPKQYTVQDERAVTKALNWFRDNQNKNGSWGEEQNEALSSLVLICFLSQGYGLNTEEYGTLALKSMKFLLSKQAPSGKFSGNSYSHGICTYAISQTYAMERIPILAQFMEKGIGYIISKQQASGGWSIDYTADGDWNLLFSAWQIQALKAAELAGSTNQKLPEALQKACTFLQKTAFVDGLFYTSSTAAKQKLISGDAQGAGATCLQLLGQKDSPEVKAAVKWIIDNVKVDKSEEWPPIDRKETFIPCARYFQTRAIFNDGAILDKNWGVKWDKELLRTQAVTGCWKATFAPEDEKDMYSDKIGIETCFTTAMNCLTLQIPRISFLNARLGKQDMKQLSLPPAVDNSELKIGD